MLLFEMCKLLYSKLDLKIHILITRQLKHNLYFKQKLNISKKYLRHNKFSSEETDGRQCTVQDERKGSEGVDGGIDICKPLKELQPATITIPDGTMPTEQNLN